MFISPSIHHILSRLSKGETPVLKLKSPVGWDSREVRIDSYERRKFHGVFIDNNRNEEALIHEDIFMFSGLVIEEVR